MNFDREQVKEIGRRADSLWDKALLWTAGLPPPWTFLLVLAYTLIVLGIGWWLGK